MHTIRKNTSGELQHSLQCGYVYGLRVVASLLLISRRANLTDVITFNIKAARDWSGD